MVDIVRVANSIRDDDPESYAAALAQVRAATDIELNQTILLGEGDRPENAHRAGIALARHEKERRQDEKFQALQRATTWRSGAIGIVGTVIGAIVGAWAARYFQ